VSLRRCGSTAAPVAKSPITAKSLVEKKAIEKQSDKQVTQAA
jgi:hypothetical protein